MDVISGWEDGVWLCETTVKMPHIYNSHYPRGTSIGLGTVILTTYTLTKYAHHIRGCQRHVCSCGQWSMAAKLAINGHPEQWSWVTTRFTGIYVGLQNFTEVLRILAFEYSLKNIHKLALRSSWFGSELLQTSGHFHVLLNIVTTCVTLAKNRTVGVQLCRGWGHEYKKVTNGSRISLHQESISWQQFEEEEYSTYFQLSTVFSASTLSALPPVARDESLIDFNQFRSTCNEYY